MWSLQLGDERRKRERYKDPSFVPRISVKMLGKVACVLISSLKRQRQEGPQGALARQSSQMGELQVKERSCVKNKVYKAAHGGARLILST